jgi:hypothetical protein
MPASARKTVVDLNTVGVYHVWGRCVRRAWLCGNDPISGVDHSERRDWIRQLQEKLAALFSMEVEFHSELSNHLHLIIRTRPDIVAKWSDEDVVRRMLTVHRIIHSESGQVEPPSAEEIQLELADAERVADLRCRLKNLSWFMKALRETVARRANRSEKITGAFWDGRFRCRKLIDETAILICGMYVDLNQIRAGEAASPEQSKYTSVFDRIGGWQFRRQAATGTVPGTFDGEVDHWISGSEEGRPIGSDAPDGWLGELTLEDGPGAIESEWNLRSRSGRRASDKGLLPLSFEKYLELLDWTGQQLNDKKRGVIPDSLAPILERLRIRSERWVDLIEHFDIWFASFVGHMDELRAAAARAGKRCLRGIRQCAAAFL